VSEMEIRGYRERAAAEWRFKDDLVKRIEDFKAEMRALDQFDRPGCNYDDDIACLLADAIDESVADANWIEHIAERLTYSAEVAQTIPDGFVYVLQAGEYYKIGKAKHLDGRIRQLKIQLPFPVQVCHAFPCEDYTATEQGAHVWWDRYRVNGEWFRLPDKPGREQFLSIKFSTVPRGEYAHIGRIGFDHHHEIPAAIWENEQWKAAIKAAFAAVEV
jgi:hypothetical protein